MGWVWRDDDESINSSSLDRNPKIENPSIGDHCSTSKIVQSKCNTVEVEPGKFIRKCEKTEQILRDCVGKPTEIVQSNKEYTEDDVTNEMRNGSSILGSSDKSPFNLPGLQNDLEAIERSIFGGLNHFFEAADEISNGFFRFLDDPSLFGGNSSSSSRRQGVPIEESFQEEPKTNSIDSESGNVDLSGLARDV
ncbi:hypothetical protein RND81_13G072600 [Saponaria officinalis]|uniref:Mal d 1-associated protein n=1 Tax=Saponaria officinalis TaxID=3572 RepID=A0AAW1H1C6_SAPOF